MRQIRNAHLKISKTAILFLTIILIGCETTTKYDLLSGDITGNVVLMDDAIGVILDCSGVTVTLEGSDPEFSVTTGTDGSFTFEEVQTGTYNLVFTKEGYGTYKTSGFQFVGGDVPEYAGVVILYQHVSVQLGTLTLEDQSAYNQVQIQLSCVVTSTEYTDCYFRYYLSDSPDVSWLNYDETYGFADYNLGNGTGWLLTDITDRFPSGTDLYAILYPCTETYSNYTETSTGTIVYASVNSDLPSNVAHIVVPEPSE